LETHLEAAADPHVSHLGLIQTYGHPLAGTIKVVGTATGMSVTPPEITRPAPLVGKHIAELLREIGYPEDRIDEWWPAARRARSDALGPG
ncbi:MAG: CoA transferase, partial [Pseudomonadota bacterium]